MTQVVHTGLERLELEPHVNITTGHSLAGEPVTLLCHPASVTRELVHAVEILQRIGARIVSLLGPEHGLDASAQDMEEVEHRRGDVPLYSLYGDSPAALIPRPDMFHDATWLVCDLQDIGSRYYTYVWTIILAAEVALSRGMRVLVLDRPNPLGGLDEWVEGGTIASGYESFVGLHPLAVRHGMTVGEIVTMVLEERGSVGRERLHVLECTAWRRSMQHPDTKLPFVPPSPNMPSFDTVLVYPGQCLLEGTNVSEGRGTTRPFETFGAPWVDAQALVRVIAAEHAPGLQLRALRFKPMFHKHAGRNCGGVQLHVKDATQVRSLRTTWALLGALWNAGTGQMRWRTERYEFVDDRPAIDLLAGGPWLRLAIEAGVSVDDMLRAQEPDRQAFLLRRRQFLRYA